MTLINFDEEEGAHTLGGRSKSQFETVESFPHRIFFPQTIEEAGHGPQQTHISR
jgi:hypothetical protein